MQNGRVKGLQKLQNEDKGKIFVLIIPSLSISPVILFVWSLLYHIIDEFHLFPFVHYSHVSSSLFSKACQISSQQKFRWTD